MDIGKVLEALTGLLGEEMGLSSFALVGPDVTLYRNRWLARQGSINIGSSIIR